MHQRVSTLDPSTSEHQLAWLLLRVVAQLSPCTEGTLVAHVTCGEGGRGASAARMQERLGNALRKLRELAFIRRAGEHIAITEEGLRILDRPPIAAAPERHESSAKASRPGGDTIEEIGHALSAALLQMRETIAAAKKAQTGEALRNEMPTAEEYPWSPLRPDAGMQVLTVTGDVAIACRGVGRIDGVAEDEEVASGASGRFMPDVRHSRLPWRYVGLLKAQGPTAFADYGSRLKRLCGHRLAEARAMWPFVAVVEAGATALPPRLTGLAGICRRRGEACLGAMARWGPQAGAKLQKLRPQFAGLERTRLLMVGSALLAVAALAVAGGAVLLSRGQATRASRFPVVWQLDRANRPIFVTGMAGKDVWVKGIAIRGENISNETLTAVGGVLKPDLSNAEINLSVDVAGDAAAAEIPPGTFTLNYAFPQTAPGQQLGISAKEFLSTYGGMIFTFHYTQLGHETTRIEYLSPSMLKAQLAEIETAAPR
jgi:hypothetical protein